MSVAHLRNIVKMNYIFKTPKIHIPTEKLDFKLYSSTCHTILHYVHVHFSLHQFVRYNWFMRCDVVNIDVHCMHYQRFTIIIVHCIHGRVSQFYKTALVWDGSAKLPSNFFTL